MPVTRIDRDAIHPKLSHSETIQALKELISDEEMSHIKDAYDTQFRRAKCSFADFACGYLANKEPTEDAW